MKWIALTSVVGLLTACGCCTNTMKTTAVEYRTVTCKPVATTKRVVTKPAVRSPVVVTTPIVYNPVATIIDEDPIDVTTTTIDYY